jgi:hypothetical protein
MEHFRRELLPAPAKIEGASANVVGAGAMNCSSTRAVLAFDGLRRHRGRAAP